MSPLTILCTSWVVWEADAEVELTGQQIYWAGAVCLPGRSDRPDQLDGCSGAKGPVRGPVLVGIVYHALLSHWQGSLGKWS